MATMTLFSTVKDLFDHVKRGDVDYIKTVDPNILLRARDEHGNTALLIATTRGDLDLCKEILRKCPSLLYHENNYKYTVLHQVLHHDSDSLRFRLFGFFISAGLEAIQSDGGTDIDMIRFEKWIKSQNIIGNTALISAVIRDRDEAVKRLVELDRQYELGLLEIAGYENKTALQWARFYKYNQIIELLTGSGVTSKGNNYKDYWSLINNKVYDVTKSLGNVLFKAKGKDATTDFKNVHRNSSNKLKMMDKPKVDSITLSLAKLASDKPQKYSRVQLEEFTKDFSQLLGSGGFGDVYKGQFPDGIFIAVKVLKNIEFKENVMKEQFLAEVETMSRAYHCNLIKLYGYCYEANTKFKALVYEYMKNGSLYTILFEKKLDIPWAKLHNIAKEIAQGISYLHESCKPQIIHQDIKPANILIDSNFSPKVIDFGLAKVNTGGSQFEQTKIKGSRDYMAPEVNQPKQVKLSCKLDVYSFGKILFDILGSKRNNVDKTWFPGQVWKKYKTGQLDKFILECGIKEEDKEKAKRLAITALLCVEHNPQARPMLSNVVKMLEGSIKQLDTPVAPFYPGYYSSASSSVSDSRDC